MTRSRGYAALLGPRGVTATWNLLAHQVQDKGALADFLLKQAAAQHTAGVRIYPQVSPRTIDVQVNWSSSILFTHLPDGWHQIIRADATRMAELPAILRGARSRVTSGTPR